MTPQVHPFVPLFLATTLLAGCKSGVEPEPPVEPAPEYAIAPLSATADADSSWTTAINEHGTVTGVICSGTCRPVAWVDGEAVVLSGGAGAARGLNDRGDVVGNVGREAFRWTDGEMEILRSATDDPHSDNRQDFAFDIDDAGTIIGGWIPTGVREPHLQGFVVRDGEFDDFPFTPQAIGRDGRIAGHQFVNAAHPLPQAWIEGEVVEVAPAAGHAYDIAEDGTVVGFVHIDGSQAFRWREGDLHLLGSLPGFDRSSASGVSSRGMIVGVSYSLMHDDRRATLWRDGRVLDLNELLDDDEWLVEEARAINGDGVIAAVARRLGSGARRAVLLTPLP
jgi:uncharacterized membrane protein